MLDRQTCHCRRHRSPGTARRLHTASSSIPTRMKVKKLTAALRQMGINGWYSRCNLYIVHMKYRLDHKGPARCPLAEAAVADRDTDRLSVGPIAKRATKASPFMNAHGRCSHT